MSFVIFLISVAIYIAFLGWCLLPIVRPRGRAWVRWLRVIVGALLIAGNFIPPLTWPIAIPVQAIGGTAATYKVSPVLFFVHSLPIYLQNVYARQYGTAQIAKVRYPIEISGVRFEPVVQTICTNRRMFTFDKGVMKVTFPRFPTTKGDEFIARIGDAALSLQHGHAVCSSLTKRNDVNLDLLKKMPLFVVRGEADKTQFYMLQNYTPGSLHIDDIVVHPPELVSIEERPAREVVSLDWLWPMPRPSDRPNQERESVMRFNKLPQRAKDCMEFVSIRPKPGSFEVRRSHGEPLPPVAQDDPAAYCRSILSRHSLLPPTDRLPEVRPVQP